jgi:hypothetical protein
MEITEPTEEVVFRAFGAAPGFKSQYHCSFSCCHVAGQHLTARSNAVKIKTRAERNQDL